MAETKDAAQVRRLARLPAATRPQCPGPDEREDGVSGSSSVQSLPLLLRGLEGGRAVPGPECRPAVAWGASPFLGCAALWYEIGLLGSRNPSQVRGATAVLLVASNHVLSRACDLEQVPLLSSSFIFARGK